MGRFAGCRAPALPGHPEGEPRASAAAYAEWLLQHVYAIPGPVVLVGHSLGGAVAMEAALMAPDVIAGLVLVATGARLPVPEAALERARSDRRRECERVARASFVREDPVAVAVLADALYASGGATLLADYEACASVDLRSRLPAIETPALVVSAAEDPLTPAWMGEELARGIPDARLVVIPEMSHAVMIEGARRLDLLVAGFLAHIELLPTGA